MKGKAFRSKKGRMPISFTSKSDFLEQAYLE